MKKEKHGTEKVVIKYQDFKSTSKVAKKVRGIHSNIAKFKFSDFSSKESFRGKLSEMQSPLCHHLKHKPVTSLSPFKEREANIEYS